MFKSTASAQQRVSIMQIAFPDEIFLLDMLFFFGDCDPQTVQKRLADQLFDDERVTVLCSSARFLSSQCHATISFRLRFPCGRVDAVFVLRLRSATRRWKDITGLLAGACRCNYRWECYAISSPRVSLLANDGST